MRELKFRAWHKKYKRMYKVLHLHMESKPWATVEGWSVPEDKPIHIRVQPKDCVLMQWTSFQDKNGNDIYEGDLCSFTPLNKESVIAEIRFEEGAFRHYQIGFAYKHIPSPLRFDEIQSYEVEVVGNIYQNLELLTNAKTTP